MLSSERNSIKNGRKSCSNSSSISIRTRKQTTNLYRRRLTQFTKWCTCFIILQSTSVGSSLMSSTSSDTVPTSTVTGSSSNMTTKTSTSSSSSSTSWQERMSPYTTLGPSTSPPLDAFPHFDALVQENQINYLRKKTTTAPKDTLLQSSIESAPSQGISKKHSTISILNTPDSRDISSTNSSLIPSRSLISRLLGNGTITPESFGMARPSGTGSSFSIKTSAYKTITEVQQGGWSKAVPDQNIPVGFSKESIPAAYKRKSPENRSAATDRFPNDNRLEAVDMVIPEGNISKMYFDTENYTTLASQVGSIVVLPCAVRNIGEGVVSWIRRNDYHLLTIGFNTYSSDERFNVIHSENTEEWPLQIKYVQLRDAGLYECQVSTHPPTSIFVELNVVEAKAEIFGPTEKYLTPGSMLRLTCRIVQSNETPLYIFWYHNNRMINYDTHRGVNVSTESDNRYSELVISHTNTLNSGNYSCVSNNAVAASTLVHIVNGENPAAMQHGDHGKAMQVASHIHLSLAFVTYQVINYVLNM